jgi:hypothetical protein
MPEPLTGHAHRGWPSSRLGPRHIVLAEGRIGLITILDTRSDVERILGVERRSLWGVRAEPAPPVALRMVFESDEELLYDSEELLLHANELGHLWEDGNVKEEIERSLAEEKQRSMNSDGFEPTTDEVALHAEEDGIVDLLLDWTDAPAGRSPDSEDPIPIVVFPDGRSMSCSNLRLEHLSDALGPPQVTEDMDETLLCEWPLEDFFIAALAESSGRIVELGFSSISIRV